MIEARIGSVKAEMLSQLANLGAAHDTLVDSALAIRQKAKASRIGSSRRDDFNIAATQHLESAQSHANALDRHSFYSPDMGMMAKRPNTTDPGLN